MSLAFEQAWAITNNEEKSEEKGKFQGYSKNTISGRAERQGKARAWSQSRKVKRGRTRKRYARNKTRGNVRPKMRRQLGAGGERATVAKSSEEQLTAAVLGGSPLSTGASPVQRLMATDPLTAMQLFSGAGGEHIARGGWLADWMRRGNKFANLDWGLDDKGKEMGIAPHFMMDVMDIDADQIMEHFGGRAPDMLVASPTCIDMSLQSVGSKWNTPEGYGPEMKEEAWEARKEGEPPAWMGESTIENPSGNWEEKGSNKGTAKLFAQTWKIAEDLMRHNPDMYSLIENPLGLARFMPFTYSKDLPDFATVNHASYTDPASSMFGIARNTNPATDSGLDPLETSSQYMGHTPSQLRYGSAHLPPLKRTDFFGRFPPGWKPRPRLGQITTDPKDDSLRDTIAQYTDFSQNPELRRYVDAPPDFLREIIREGFRGWSPRQMAKNNARKQPFMRVGQAGQLGGPGRNIRMSSPLSGSMFAFAPKGSNRGVNQTRGFSYMDPKTGGLVRIPAYHARSITPLQMGADFGRAVEQALGAEPPVQPETQFHRENPNERIQSFLDKGGLRTKTQLEDYLAPSTTRWLQSQGIL